MELTFAGVVPVQGPQGLNGMRLLGDGWGLGQLFDWRAVTIHYAHAHRQKPLLCLLGVVLDQLHRLGRGRRAGKHLGAVAQLLPEVAVVAFLGGVFFWLCFRKLDAEEDKLNLMENSAMVGRSGSVAPVGETVVRDNDSEKKSASHV